MKLESMPVIKSVRGFDPVIPEDCFVAENATIIGDVNIGSNCSVWFNVILRGDVNYIKIGNNVNIQDGTVVHGTYEKSATTLSDNVSIGHNAIIHGCHIHSNVLVGMGAVVMDGCEIEEWSFIAAGAVLLPGTRVKSYSLYGGIPARHLKEVSDEQIETIKRTTLNYSKYAKWYI